MSRSAVEDRQKQSARTSARNKHLREDNLNEAPGCYRADGIPPERVERAVDKMINSHVMQLEAVPVQPEADETEISGREDDHPESKLGDLCGRGSSRLAPPNRGATGNFVCADDAADLPRPSSAGGYQYGAACRQPRTNAAR